MKDNIFYSIAGIVIIFALFSLSGCSVYNSSNEPHKTTVFAMDTVMTLTAYGPNGEEALKAATEEINRLDALFSISSDKGDVWKVNNTGSYAVSDDTAALVKRAVETGDMTDGLFDITIGPVMDAWGFTTREYRVPDESELRELTENVDYSKIVLSEDGLLKLPDNMKIDLGGIAKGYTSDRVMEIFSEHGVSSGIISLGGNVQALGVKPDGKKWRVLIEQPREAVFEIEDKAVITSGDYERNFTKDGVTYHHIIDARTGYPANSGLTSVTVVSDDGTLADGLSTSLFIMGLSDASEFWRKNHDLFEAVFMTWDGDVYITEGLEDSFTMRDAGVPEVIRRFAA